MITGASKSPDFADCLGQNPVHSLHSLLRFNVNNYADDYCPDEEMRDLMKLGSVILAQTPRRFIPRAV